jgi:hypothetical protein
MLLLRSALCRSWNYSLCGADKEPLLRRFFLFEKLGDFLHEHWEFSRVPLFGGEFRDPSQSGLD